MHSFKLRPVAPFRLDLTVWALRRRKDNIIDRWDGSVYRRLFVLEGQAVDVAVVQSGSPDKPELEIEASAALSACQERLESCADLAEIIEDIRKLGFSYNKSQAFIELAQVFVNNGLELEDLESQDDETVRERFCELRGVGRWTAEYAMLRGLVRIHLFPGDDVGARNKLRRWLKLEKPIGYGDVHDILARWEPYGGFIYFHLLLDSLAEEGFL